MFEIILFPGYWESEDLSRSHRSLSSLSSGSRGSESTESQTYEVEHEIQQPRVCSKAIQFCSPRFHETFEMTDKGINPWKIAYCIEKREKNSCLFEQLKAERNARLNIESVGTVTLQTSDDIDEGIFHEWTKNIVNILGQYTEEHVKDAVKEIGEEKYGFAWKKAQYLYEARSGMDVVLYFENTNEMHIVGCKRDVPEIESEIIRNILEASVVKEEYRLSLENRTIAERCRLYKKLRKECFTVEIHEQTNRGILELEGFEEDVLFARNLLTKWLHKSVVYNVQIDERKANLIKTRKYVRREISKECREKSRDIRWELDNNLFLMICPKQIEPPLDIVGDLIGEVFFDLNDFENETVMTSVRWQEHKRFLEANYGRYMDIQHKSEDNKLYITCTSGCAWGLEDSVSKFFELCKIKSKEKLQTAETEHIWKHGEQFLSDLEKELADEFVRMDIQSDSIVLSGTKQGIRIASDKLADFANELTKLHFGVTSQYTSQRIRSDEGRKVVEEVEKRHRCVLRLHSAPKVRIVEENIEDQQVNDLCKYDSKTNLSYISREKFNRNIPIDI